MKLSAKWYLSTFLLSVITLCAAGETEIDVEKRVYFSPEKEQQIIEVAKKICADFAPDYDISCLTPVLFDFEIPCPRSYPKEGTMLKMVSVKFMKDTTDYIRYDRLNNHRTGHMTVTPLRRPKAVIHAEVYPETLEPAGIGAYTGTLFLPDYKTFLAEHPDFRLKKAETPEYIKNLRNVNEVAKEELEAQGYKVTIGTTDDK